MNRAERGHKKEGDREEDGRRGRQMIEIAQGKHGGEGNTMRDGKTRGVKESGSENDGRERHKSGEGYLFCLPALKY